MKNTREDDERRIPERNNEGRILERNNEGRIPERNDEGEKRPDEMMNEEYQRG